jgi:hypothetical protein
MFIPNQNKRKVTLQTIIVRGLRLALALAAVAGLTIVAPHSYARDAFDAVGNRSAQSDSTVATTAPIGTFIFEPVADAYVHETEPNANFGSTTILRTDASPELLSYLTFDVQGLAGLILRATLRLYAETASDVGYDVREVTDTHWEESSITYDNAPAFGPVVSPSGPFRAGTWTTVDVTPLIAGNGPVSLALTTAADTAARYASRESGDHAPQLVIEMAVVSPPTSFTNFVRLPLIARYPGDETTFETPQAEEKPAVLIRMPCITTATNPTIGIFSALFRQRLNPLYAKLTFALKNTVQHVPGCYLGGILEHFKRV